MPNFFTTNHKHNRMRALFVLGAVAIPFFFLFFTGFIGTSSARIERDHSISVPRSTSNIQCNDGFVSMTTFADVGASASFEVSREDMPIFLTQFKNLKAEPIPNDPSDSSLHHSVPEHFGRVIFTFYGMSRDRNMMHVDVYDIDASKVGVWISTIWN